MDNPTGTGALVIIGIIGVVWSLYLILSARAARARDRVSAARLRRAAGIKEP